MIDCCDLNLLGENMFSPFIKIILLGKVEMPTWVILNCEG